MVLLCLCAAVAREAQADGGYVPPVSIQTVPDLPRQRAILVYDVQAGTETLVIESFMSAPKGNHFAWLLPLPSVPSSIKQADPGILSTLEVCLQPELINSSQWSYVPPFLALLGGLWLLAFVRTKGGMNHLYFILKSICVLMIILFFLMLWGPRLVPQGGGSGSSAAIQADVLHSERVGNYNVVVLRGDNHKAIASWLDKNQFAPLRPGAAKVIDDYLKEGWVILAADLMRSGSGVMAAHPLQVTFKTEEPVYPMRLTGQADSTTDVRLFAFGTKSPLTHPDLKLEWADRVATGLEYWRSWEHERAAKDVSWPSRDKSKLNIEGLDSPLLNKYWHL